MIIFLILYIITKEWKKEWLDTINAYRATNSAPPLKENVNLNRAAEIQSNHLSYINDLTHKGPKGLEHSTSRAASVGYMGSSVSENIGKGYGVNFKEIFEAWKESKPHNATMLDKSLNETGMSYEGGNGSFNFWVQVFGTSGDVEDDPSNHKRKQENDRNNNLKSHENDKAKAANFKGSKIKNQANFGADNIKKHQNDNIDPLNIKNILDKVKKSFKPIKINPKCQDLGEKLDMD